ncbi:copper resistance protein CopC [Nocardioides sp.]|uniref:copper resistance protein CopC n=1 Tax=Nocardioides sp. TaxID=35761 RepID=UPI00262D2BA8|nr:copper resistance protein CopC [Nocardioides sp.]
MECSEVREALSAQADGEEVTVTGDALAVHLDGCEECRAFEARLAALSAVTVRAAEEPAPIDLAGIATARWQRRRESRMYILRWAVGLMGGAELANALLQLVMHGTSEAHSTHESLSFAVAISLALVYASVRPALAAGYLPIVGTAVGLLLLTAGFDVASGRISAVDELPHVDLLIGCVLMWFLAREHGPGPGTEGRRWRPLRPSAYARLRIVPSGGRMARIGKIALGTAIASGIVLTPGVASAHAVLDSSDPAPNSVVTTAPTRIDLRFSESVTLPTGGLQVFAPDGTRADAGGASADGSRLSVPLKATAQGTYLVSWRVVSADSHPVSGAFTYSVGHASTAPAAPKVADDTSLTTALGVGRFVGYAGAALLIGGVALWMLGWSPSRTGQRVALGGAAALAVAGVADLLIKGPLDAALGWGSIGDGSLLGEVLGTTYGRAELTRVVLAVLAGVLVVARHRIGRREFAVVFSLFAVLIALTFALAGHAAAGTAPAMSVPSWTIHALAMAVWVGGLVHLVVDRVWRATDASVVLPRFSLVALCCVGALLVSGVFQSWRQVRSWGALKETHYGHLLSIKVLLVAVVVVIGYGSRRLLRTAGSPAALGRTVLMEVGGGAVVLALTAGLVATEPAETAYRPTVSANLTLQGDTVQVSAVPKGTREVEVHLYVFDKAGESTDPDEIRAELTLPASAGSAAIGPLPVDLVDIWTGHRSAVVSVPVAGDWKLAVTVRVSDFDEATGTVTVPIR